MRSPSLLIFFVATCAFGFLRPASSNFFDTAAKDCRGHIVRLSKTPLRVVSLCPGTTEMIFAVGLGNRLIADTTYCDIPKEAKSLSKIGDVTTSIEKVIALNPDLVVASYSANHKAVDLLEQHGQKVFCIDSSSLEEVANDMITLGRLTRTVKLASVAAEKMRSRIRALKSAVVRSNSKPKVLVIVQFDPLIVVGPHNFMNDLLVLAGATNVGVSTGKAWGGISPEQVIALQPEIIIAGARIHQRILNRPGWNSLPAVKNKKIFASPGDESVRPGPRLVVALETLIRYIHPEITIPPP